MKVYLTSATLGNEHIVRQGDQMRPARAAYQAYGPACENFNKALAGLNDSLRQAACTD